MIVRFERCSVMEVNGRTRGDDVCGYESAIFSRTAEGGDDENVKLGRIDGGRGEDRGVECVGSGDRGGVIGILSEGRVARVSTW